MNVQFTAGKFSALDNNGDQYVGAKVWAYLAGTSTPGNSYSDPECTALNSWPVVLDARGEAFIYVDISTDFYLTTPAAIDISSPIWESRKVGQQQGVPPLLATVTPGTTHNQYVATITPVALSIANQQEIKFIPDVDSAETLTTLPGQTSPTVFTGSGINDIIWSGPFLGSTSGSVFQVQALAIGVEPPAACDAVLSGTAGSVTAGAHYVKITFLTAEGETTLGNASALVTADGTHKIDLTNIPVGAAGKGVTSRKIYMTKAGGAVYYYVDQLPDNTTTIYSINVADAALTVAAPSTNTTGDGTGIDLVQWRKDGGAWTPASLTDLLQITIEGMGFTSAQKTGHYLNDLWAVTVETPVTLDFSGLGAKLVYKIIGGQVKALGAGDLKAGYSATLVWNQGQNAYILNNPSLPVYSTQVPQRVRREIYGDHTVTADDWGRELSCNANCTITFPALATLPSEFFYIHPGAWAVTVATDPGTPTNKIIPPFSNVGVTSYLLYVGGPGTIQLGNNGASLHILTQVSPVRDTVKTTIFSIPGAVTGAASADAGVVTVGDHLVKVAFIMGSSYSVVGTASATITAADSLHKIDLSNIPLGPYGTTARRVYMTKAGPGATYYFVADIPNNTATTYKINVADAALTVAAPSNGLWTKTAGYNYAYSIVEGGGGGSARGDGGVGGGAGGAPGRSEKTIDITAITSEVVTVGVGGTAGTGGGVDGGDGGTSSFGSHNSATGGKAGIAVTTTGLGGVGGAGVDGDINVTGQTGMSVVNATSPIPTVGGAGLYGKGGDGGVIGADGNPGSNGIVIVRETR